MSKIESKRAVIGGGSSTRWRSSSRFETSRTIIIRASQRAPRPGWRPFSNRDTDACDRPIRSPSAAWVKPRDTRSRAKVRPRRSSPACVRGPSGGGALHICGVDRPWIAWRSSGFDGGPPTFTAARPPAFTVGRRETPLAAGRRRWPPGGAAGRREAPLAAGRRRWPPGGAAYSATCMGRKGGVQRRDGAGTEPGRSRDGAVRAERAARPGPGRRFGRARWRRPRTIRR